MYKPQGLGKEKRGLLDQFNERDWMEDNRFRLIQES